MQKIDFGVIGRAIAVGTGAGAVAGFIVMILLLFGAVIAEEHVNPNPNMAGLVLAAIVGALVGLLTGLVAGLLLLLPASRLRDRPLRGAVACALAGGGTLSAPFLVVGFGSGTWVEMPWGWAVVGLVACTAAVGAWRSRYILAGRAAAESDQPSAGSDELSVGSDEASTRSSATAAGPDQAGSDELSAGSGEPSAGPGAGSVGSDRASTRSSEASAGPDQAGSDELSAGSGEPSAESGAGAAGSDRAPTRSSEPSAGPDQPPAARAAS